MTHKTYIRLITLSLAAIPVGAIVGVICALFGRVLLLIGDIRSSAPVHFVPFLALAGLAIVFAYQHYGKNAGQGMGLIFRVSYDEEEHIPLRLVPLIMVSTWITHLFGGSAGREGVAVQMGACIAHWFGKRLPLEDSGHIFLIAGMAAGFAGLFQTPVAAVFFAMEVTVAGALEISSLLPALTAAFTASSVSSLLGLEKFSVDLASLIGQESAGSLKFSLTASPVLFIKLMLLGLLFGLTGALFAWLLGKCKALAAAKLKNPYIRAAATGIFLSIVLLLLYTGRYCGLGTNLISASFSDGQIYAWDWILKLLLTIITLSAGYQGGEVTPLFSIGASLGIFLAGIFGLPAPFVAALGYAAVFGSATNTLFAPIFIGGEVFGFEYIPYFFLVSAVAYFCNYNQCIYTAQKAHKSVPVHRG